MKDHENQNGSGSSDTPARRALSLRRKILFSLCTVLLVFFGLEMALRLIGFKADQRVESMEFTFPIDDYNNKAPQPFLERDDQLFWKPRAGVLDHNSHGFYGPEFTKAKPDGVFRIVCMGDSCTHFGPTSYPDILRAVLEERAPGQFEVINAGVIGYTSHQGRTLLTTQVLDWSPDLVTVYYGWNDHWLARGLEDKNQTSAEESAAVTALSGLRLFQLARMLKSGTGKRNSVKMRVEPEDYRGNLSAIESACTKQGIKVWYLTAAHAFDMGIPPYLSTSGEVADTGGLIQLHQDYNSIVREVAKHSSATVIDLASEMDQMDKRQLFIDDHIHLSETGRAYVAQRLMQTLEQQEILKARAPATE